MMEGRGEMWKPRICKVKEKKGEVWENKKKKGGKKDKA